MPTFPTLLLFVVAVLGLMVSPGPNMALIVSQSLSRGVRGGLASAAGILVADVIMTLLVCAGIAALAAAWPPSFDVLRYLGVIYLVGLAINALRHRSLDLQGKHAQPSLRHAFHRATLVSLLNPKALLFFLVFLPQFVDSSRGDVTTQLLVLGLLLSGIAFVFHAMLGIASGRVATVLRGHTGLARWLDRLQAGVLTGLAVRLLLLERPLRI